MDVFPFCVNSGIVDMVHVHTHSVCVCVCGWVGGCLLLYYHRGTSLVRPPVDYGTKMDIAKLNSNHRRIK